MNELEKKFDAIPKINKREEKQLKFEQLKTKVENKNKLNTVADLIALIKKINTDEKIIISNPSIMAFTPFSIVKNIDQKQLKIFDEELWKLARGKNYDEFWNSGAKEFFLDQAKDTKKNVTVQMKILQKMFLDKRRHVVSLTETIAGGRDSIYHKFQWLINDKLPSINPLFPSRWFKFKENPYLEIEFKPPGQKLAQYIIFIGFGSSAKRASFTPPHGYIGDLLIDEILDETVAPDKFKLSWRKIEKLKRSIIIRGSIPEDAIPRTTYTLMNPLTIGKNPLIEKLEMYCPQDVKKLKWELKDTTEGKAGYQVWEGNKNNKVDSPKIFIMYASNRINEFRDVDALHEDEELRKLDPEFANAILDGIHSAFIGSAYGNAFKKIRKVSNDWVVDDYDEFIGGGDWGQTANHDSYVPLIGIKYLKDKDEEIFGFNFDIIEIWKHAGKGIEHSKKQDLINTVVAFVNKNQIDEIEIAIDYATRGLIDDLNYFLTKSQQEIITFTSIGDKSTRIKRRVLVYENLLKNRIGVVEKHFNFVEKDFKLAEANEKGERVDLGDHFGDSIEYAMLFFERHYWD